MRYVYRGEEGEFIPLHATHISVREDVRLIRARAFDGHPNIIEVLCHDKVEKIERNAFACCPLRRVIMPGVKILEYEAFYECNALTDVECGKLEIIGNGAFVCCESLKSINLPSARIVERETFCFCESLTDVNFSCKLERIELGAFSSCTSLERITIPLKDGLITTDDIFEGCRNLNLLELVDEGELHETIAALHLEEWRNVMYEEIESINQTLPTADAGVAWENNVGELAVTIRTWIGSVLRHLGHYKAQHRCILDEDVAPTLQRFVPQDIVMNIALPFLELPPNSLE